MHSSTAPRVPPGQHLTEAFPVLDWGIPGSKDKSQWRLKAEGLIENPQEWGWDEFSALPATSSVSDFHCVTTWSRLDNKWEGISFSVIVQRVKPRPEARYVTIVAGDSYFTSLPLADLMEMDVLLAYAHDGQALSPEHGGLVRLVVPHKYGYKSAKWVETLRFTREQELGFWEQRGYSNTADPWNEDRLAP